MLVITDVGIMGFGWCGKSITTNSLFPEIFD
jgi:hypothetical protein